MTLSEYSQLKDEIILNVNTSEKHNELLTVLKELFREDINSVRRYERINTIGQLLQVLEIRDVLSEDNVSPLKVIARKLPSGNILSRITEYEEFHVPRDVMNYYASKTSSKRETAQETFINSNPLGGNMSDRKRQRIFDTLNEEIGTHWRDLGRFLNMKESFIDEIECQNIPLRAKVTQLMERYIETKADPQRWFFVLCEALEQARRKDLAKTLQEIMVMNI
ncbi:hypothetical protein K1T71_004459 [Dendrolimus kikuchii]|uniref:Uncharacterized protein n=1 Tax=Dendrolimus kikuchii TaxID=765133 RepID=A0ACC1D7I1_9NEOP|nr:hypothetical protein K1T71_004459 [Dendrolimus kikuchii]